MIEYKYTGNSDTDNCLKLANMAHNFYFNDVLKYKIEFILLASEFYEVVEKQLIKKNNSKNLYDSLKKLFYDNNSMFEYFKTELYAIKTRLKIIRDNPNLLNDSTKFILDHTARFMEVILPYVTPIKEMESYRKFKYDNFINDKLHFFEISDQDKSNNNYISSFFASAWRAQKNLNGIRYLKNDLNLSNKRICEYYQETTIDYYSTLIFSRMANEQFLKYSSYKRRLYEDNDDKRKSIPDRIDDLVEVQELNPLIANEAKLVNSRGNNIAHKGIPGVFSSCYHCLELLNYYKKYCI